LLRRTPFSERAAAGPLGGGLEDGVVPEAAAALGRERDPSTTGSAGDEEPAYRSVPLGQRESQDADIASRSLPGRQSLEHTQQLGVVLLVGGLLSRVPPGAHARP